jgi:hypothetical protein
MKTLKRLTLAVALMLVLGLSAFAGETQSPPCAAPGQTETPPCAAALMAADASLAPGETSDSATSNAGASLPVAELALDLLQSALLLF